LVLNILRVTYFVTITLLSKNEVWAYMIKW